MEHANIQIFVVILIISGLILYKIFTARRGREMYIRRIPGLTEIDEAIGRSTEMGRPMIFHPGVGDLQNIATLAALGVLGYVARQSARLGARLIVTTAFPVIVPVAEDIVKQSYEQEGRPELFDSSNIRFLAVGGDQLALATSDLMRKERSASHFFFGSYDYTSLLLTEPGNHTGAMQIAGTSDYFQVPFFIASCDYTVIGEELFAASAYLTREPTMLGSLIGQDYAKIGILLLIVLGAISVTILGADNLFVRLVSMGK